jgi:hypothetical protein
MEYPIASKKLFHAVVVLGMGTSVLTSACSNSSTPGTSADAAIPSEDSATPGTDASQGTDATQGTDSSPGIDSAVASDSSAGKDSSLGLDSALPEDAGFDSAFPVDAADACVGWATCGC